MSSHPLYHDVDGSPRKIGDRVRTGEGTDETFDEQYKGLTGTVAYLEYECGCGQTYPTDPMIGVRLDTGALPEFWTEELEKTRRKSRNS